MPSREQLPLAELLPLIRDVLASGEGFRLYPRGHSMEPMLYEGRDSVLLVRPENIRPGDVLLYRRDNGMFVLHRLIAVQKGGYLMCGDHQSALEYGIRPEQVIAKVGMFYKGETAHDPETDAAYRKYTARQIRRFPFYRKNKTVYTFLRKVKHTLFRDGGM